MLEFTPPVICGDILDLDCNDSSGATDADYNADDVDCLHKETAIADIDIGMEYEAIIEEMRVEIVGTVPDAPLEVLISTGNVPNIDVDGDGTDLITLTNLGGAKSTDFKEALKLIRYQNNAEVPTGGLRTVEVQFTTEIGSQSNVATAFINVVELPGVPVDLGDDVQICEGESATFDAGMPGLEYEWSTGDDTQMITVDQSGEYMVTVDDGENCPGVDTVVLVVLPVIDVSLSGDTELCDNQQATIIINTETPFALDIDITAEPGSPFSFPNVTGTLSFNDLISDQTTYTITSVTTSQDACINLSDPVHVIDVYASYIHSFDVSFCDGDSVWLGFYWETEAGVYENTFDSYFGCDSVVTTTIAVLPEIPVTAQATTCDTADVGVFVTIIDNPNGCDTIVTTTVTLVSMDTTTASAVSCRMAEVGITQSIIPGSDGCDSLVILTTTYLAPTDTTFLIASTCDSAALGTTQLILAGNDGCDSLLITSTTLSPADTTYTFGTSCDSATIGVFHALLQNQNGCDSLVITTITAGVPDTINTTATSCDSATLGTIVTHFTSVHGCDSVIIHTVTYSAVDSTFESSTTCDPGHAGMFVEQYTNQYGCDSIVTTTVSLLPSDNVSVVSTTCDPELAGTSVQQLQNMYGCDSLITTTISLLPSSTTKLFETTCISSNTGVFVSALINQYGCDSIVTTTVTLADADTTRINIMTCFEDEVGETETLLISADGCDSLVVSTTALHPETVVTLATLYDYNGYDISCEGVEDGGISANSSGTPPFAYIWSTGSPDHQITGLASGQYTVTVTDGNGCEIISSIDLHAASALVLAFSVSEPDCFDNALGTITAIASGGVPPYTYSIDGTHFQTSSAFQQLENGVYQVSVRDVNECITAEIVSIHVPLSIQVELGDDQVIALGDSAAITAVVNVPFDSIVSINWHSIDSVDCPNCLTQIVAPIITTAYSISVSSVDGCSDADSMTVHVSTDHNFYIPNIFSPNGDGINDVITVHVGEDVERILLFEVFDRWGNLVFGKNNVDANEVVWDGSFNGNPLNPGVFTYKASIHYTDGLKETRYGDITLIR